MPLRVEHWKFRPHPILRGGHLQTVAGIYLPRRDPPYGAVRHYVDADEAPAAEGGDQLVLHEDRPAEWREGQPVVLVVHGLAGSYQSTYMTRLAHRLTQRGHCVFRMDLRGCGDGRHVARHPTHCGRSDDLATALRYLAQVHSESPTLVVGFSLSGAHILKMLGEQGPRTVGNYTAGLAICPPVDLFAIERRFDSPGGRPYDKFFTRLLWKQALERWRRYPEIAPRMIPSRPKRLRQIDEMIIAPAAGFDSAEEYYAGTQCGPLLAGIEQPVTIIAAEDDPIVPTAPLREYPHGGGVRVVYVPSGGHLGFIGRSEGDPDHRWLDWRIVEWVEHDGHRWGKPLLHSEKARLHAPRAVARS
jgi:predicted alpha/beta-fold hydrolase